MRIRELLVAVEELAEPGELLVVVRLRVALPFLVAPVRGDPELRVAVHVARADLHLHALAVGTDHRGVQALVAVGLGQRDVVLEAPRNGTPGAVHDAERRVDRVGRAVEDHAERDHVVDLVERETLGRHLRLDRREFLLAPRHLGDQPGLLQLRLERAEHLADVLRALLALRMELLLEIGGDLRAQRPEREIDQLASHPVDAEPVRQRRVDVHRLLRDALARFLAT